MSEDNHFEMSFGKEVKRNLFLLDDAITFVNHGSYGATPRSIFEKKYKLQQELENAPDKWFRISTLNLWTQNIRSLAEFLQVDSNNLVLCENATEAINAALKSIEFNGSNDAILATQYTYGAILNTIDYVAKYRFSPSNQVQIFKVPFSLPSKSKEQVIQEFDQVCEEIIKVKKLRLRVAVIDHISSATAILYPIKELIGLIRKWTTNSSETLILIDGAHAIGHTQIQLNDLDCDFYVSNLHKWFFSPKSCSFLYLKEIQNLSKDLQPNYISHGYHKDFQSNFFMRATTDKSSFFLVNDCVAFHRNMGGLDTIQKYANDTLKKASEMLTKAWDTQTLEIHPDLESPFLRLIKLPHLPNYEVKYPENASIVCEQLVADLIIEYKVVSCVVHILNELYCRIACFVYNELSDYEVLRDAILHLKNKPKSIQV